MTTNDLDLINADLMSEIVPNAFGREAQPGDELNGVLVAVERKHRYDSQGQALYWVDRKPSPIEAGPAVIDNVLIWQTEDETGPEDDGRRSLRLDRDVKQALFTAVREAGCRDGVALGGQITGFKLVSQGANGGRFYSGGTYTPPAA